MKCSQMVFVLALLLAACGGANETRLFGSISTSLNLDFTRVEVAKQTTGGTFTAMRVMYVYDKNDITRYPVITVANAPVTRGEEKSLLGDDGTVYRQMDDSSSFPTMEKGHILFTELGDVDGPVEGEFYVTFVSKEQNKTTLNGTFASTLIEVGN